jgi:hypothetical protein
MTRRLSEEALLTALHAWHLASPRRVRRLPGWWRQEEQPSWPHMACRCDSDGKVLCTI